MARGPSPRRDARRARQPRVSVEALIPDRAREVVVYCAAGARSAFAAKSLPSSATTNMSSMIGGFTDWKRNGYAFTTPRDLTPSNGLATHATS